LPGCWWPGRSVVRLFLLAGAVGNAIVAVTSVVTRTVGLLIGPSADDVEAVGCGDIVSTVFEVAIVVGAIVLWRSQRWREEQPLRSHRAEVANAFMAIGITLLTTLALYSSVGGSPSCPSRVGTPGRPRREAGHTRPTGRPIRLE